MKTNLCKRRLSAGISLMLCALGARADVTLSPMIGDHMVLQQGIAAPVWGSAAPGEEVTVQFRGQQKRTVADAQGKWIVKLDPLKPGDPASLTVAGRNTLTLSDVLVGEVWVGSGQSNIDSPLSMYWSQDLALKEAAGKSHPQLRILNAARRNGWKEVKPDDPARFEEQHVARFSAQLFYFGLLLQKELNVPVGVIEAAKGGMPSGVFLSQEGFRADAAIQAALSKWEAQHPFESEQKQYEAALDTWKKNVAGALAASGTAQVPADSAALVSGTDSIPREILSKFPQPKAPVRAADIKTGDVFEAIVRPVIPYGIRGVLWDQGESYAGVGAAVGQNLLMPALIRSWRKDWGQGDFPWIFVQKQNGGGCALNPDDPVNKGAKPFEPLPKDPPPRGYDSVEGYNSQNPPNTFLSQTSDLVPGVHPINKTGYATRDLRVALGGIYGQPMEYSGPVFQSFKAEGGKVRIAYTHVGKGLTVPSGQKLQGFAIAGEDKKFHWAEAAIEGQNVVVSSPEVPSPVAVRYWHGAWANLFNKDGLPALGFRTDSW